MTELALSFLFWIHTLVRCRLYPALPQLGTSTVQPLIVCVLQDSSLDSQQENKRRRGNTGPEWKEIYRMRIRNVVKLAMALHFVKLNVLELSSPCLPTLQVDSSWLYCVVCG